MLVAFGLWLGVFVTLTCMLIVGVFIVAGAIAIALHLAKWFFGLVYDRSNQHRAHRLCEIVGHTSYQLIGDGFFCARCGVPEPE